MGAVVCWLASQLSEILEKSDQLPQPATHIEVVQTVGTGEAVLVLGVTIAFGAFFVALHVANSSTRSLCVASQAAQPSPWTCDAATSTDDAVAEAIELSELAAIVRSGDDCAIRAAARVLGTTSSECRKWELQWRRVSRGPQLANDIAAGEHSRKGRIARAL